MERPRLTRAAATAGPNHVGFVNPLAAGIGGSFSLNDLSPVIKQHAVGRGRPAKNRTEGGRGGGIFPVKMIDFS